jgi:alpha-galactosidase
VVTHDARADSWTIGASDVPLAMGFARDGALVLFGFNGDSQGVLLADRTDAPVRIDGREIVLGDMPKAGVAFAGDRIEDYRGGLRLTLAFNATSAHAHIRRHFVTYPNTPVIETWFEIERLDPKLPITVSDIAAFRVGVAGRDLQWKRGLLADEGLDEAFRDEVQPVGDGVSFAIGAAGRSTATSLPWAMMRAGRGTFFGGLLWSGGWRIAAAGDSAGTVIVAGLGDTETTVPAEGPLEGVHGFFGGVPGGEADVAAAMRTFLVDGLRQGREFPALVSYNSWFVRGATINEANIRQEINAASQIGVEVFQLDAGWHAGAGAKGPYDYTSGLGSWQVDEERFPHGLGAIGETVRAAGMRFGLWTEPERVDVAVVGQPGGPDESWLAASDGALDPGVPNEEADHAMVCLAHPAAWRWVHDHLARLVERDGVEYLIIDSNDWINCTREGHGHGPRDGNFAHVQALYRLLEALRERFPHLLVENCAGGGNRIDLGLARYTDAGWMDDRTNPAMHVRHNLEGLSQLFPPSYLFSYVMPSGQEPMIDAVDFKLLVRSRMPGVMGLSYRFDELGEREYSMLASEVDVYRRARALVPKASAVLLSPRVYQASWPAWEVMEHVTPDGGAAVVFAFHNDGAIESVRVVLQRLAPDASFAVESADAGPLGEFTGQALMSQGFELAGSPNTGAHVIFVQRVNGAASRVKRP